MHMESTKEKQSNNNNKETTRLETDKAAEIKTQTIRKPFIRNFAPYASLT